MAKAAGKKGTKAAGGAEVPRRLTPTDETLRMLYLLSGNNCAMPDCNRVILDRKGAVVGDVCHIESAMPDGPRFNHKMTNEQRRSFPNLVLFCAAHHKQVDHKKRVADWTVEKLQRIKRDHEARFSAIGESIRRAFKTQYKDSTDDLAPTLPSTFARLDALPGSGSMTERDKEDRAKKLRRYVSLLQVVPEDERAFMLAVMNRWRKTKATNHGHRVSVNVYDLESALGINSTKVKRMGAALERLSVGCINEVGFDEGNRHQFEIYDPSDTLPWAEIIEFCDTQSVALESFVLDINFAQLD